MLARHLAAVAAIEVTQHGGSHLLATSDRVAGIGIHAANTGDDTAQHALGQVSDAVYAKAQARSIQLFTEDVDQFKAFIAHIFIAESALNTLRKADWCENTALLWQGLRRGQDQGTAGLGRHRDAVTSPGQLAFEELLAQLIVDLALAVKA